MPKTKVQRQRRLAKTRAALFRSTAAAAATGVTLTLCGPADAITVQNWTNAVGGTFADAGNWNGGAGPVPGTTEAAAFELNATYTVNFTTSPTNAATQIDAGNITWLASGATRTYTLTGNGGGNVSPRAGSTLTINAPGATTPLNVSASTFSPWTDATINLLAGTTTASLVGASGTVFGVTPTAPAVINVSGTPAAGTNLNGASMILGGLGTGNRGRITYGANSSGVYTGPIDVRNGLLRLDAGADVLAWGTVTVGGFVTQDVDAIDLVVTGAGTTFIHDTSSTSSFALGAASGNVTTVTVTDGGAITAKGLVVNKTATLDFTGGTLNAAGGIVVDGGTFKRTAAAGTYNPTGAVVVNTVKNGGVAEIVGNFDCKPPTASQATLTVTGAGSQFITTGDLATRGAEVNVQAGGKLAPAILRTDGAFGVTVEGAGSAIVGGSLQQKTGSSVRLMNGATATFSGEINLGGSSGASWGGLHLESGTQVVANGPVNVVGLTGAGTARLDLSGAGTALTQSGAGVVTVGGTVGSSMIVANAGGGTLTTGTGGLTVNPTGQITGGGLTVNANGNVTFSGSTSPLTSSLRTINFAAGKSITLNGARASFAGDLFLSSNNSLAATGSRALISAQQMTLTGDSTVSVTGGARLSATKLAVTGGRVTTGGNGGTILVTGPIDVAAHSQIDLTDGVIVARDNTVGTASGGTYSGLSGLVQAGHHAGAWDGGGIITSEPDAAAGLTSIGVAWGGLPGQFPTRWSVAPGDVIVAYTYVGDANLDGFVSGDDYAGIDGAVTVPGAFGWSNGDFNWDGIISGDDYAAIDSTIVAQGAPISHGAAAFASVTAVPEPAAAAAGAAFVALPLLLDSLRRRRGVMARAGSATPPAPGA